MTVFAGFPAEAWDFLDGLAADNTTAYLNLHREYTARRSRTPLPRSSGR